ncbi:hypothetical protein RQP46_000378 [Phenoliferia psychrophenolica]
MRRYGLDSPTRRAAVDRICGIAKLYFKSTTVIITLVLESHQVLAAERSWVAGGDPALSEPVRETPYDSSFCAHGMTQLDPSATFDIPNAQADWRFKHNPHTVPAGGGLSSYASANIHLTTSGSQNPLVPSTLPVGSLCIIDSRPRSASGLSDEDKSLLHDLAAMVGREFELGFEAQRRKVEIGQTEFLGAFLNTLLSIDTTSPTTDPTNTALSAYKSATEKVRSLTSAHSAAIFDLRSLRAPMPPSKHVPAPATPAKPRRNASVADQFKVGGGSIFLLGSSGDVDYEKVVEREDVGKVVCEAIQLYYETGTSEYDGITKLSPLDPVLPYKTTGSLLVPVFDVAGRPALLLVLTSSEKRFRFVRIPLHPF